MYERILVPLDGSALAEAALPYAEKLAGSLGSDVSLVYVKESDEEQAQFAHQPYLEKAAKIIEQGVQRYTNESGVRLVQVLSTVLSGNPAEQVKEHADKEDIGLIVMTTKGQSGIKGRALGSVADKVVRTTDCPVLLIRGSGCASAAREEDPLNKVMVPLDGAKHLEPAVPYISELASKLQAEVILFHVLAAECYVSGT